MTGADFITAVKNMINASPTSYTPAQYLDAVNYAINYVCKRRIDKNDPEFIFPLGVVNGQDQPADFVKFAGNFPIEIRDMGVKRQWFYTGSMVQSKYYRNRPNLTLTSEQIPLNYHHTEAAKLAAAIYLKEQRGFNMAQEKARLEEMLA
jgi:hypothetical protein